MKWWKQPRMLRGRLNVTPGSVFSSTHRWSPAKAPWYSWTFERSFYRTPSTHGQRHRAPARAKSLCHWLHFQLLRFGSVKVEFLGNCRHDVGHLPTAPDTTLVAKVKCRGNEGVLPICHFYFRGPICWRKKNWVRSCWCDRHFLTSCNLLWFLLLGRKNKKVKITVSPREKNENLFY